MFWNKPKKEYTSETYTQKIEREKKKFDEDIAKYGLKIDKDNDEFVIHLRKSMSGVTAQQRLFEQNQQSFFSQIDANNKEVIVKIEGMQRQIQAVKGITQKKVAELNQLAHQTMERTSSMNSKIKQINEIPIKISKLGDKYGSIYQSQVDISARQNQHEKQLDLFKRKFDGSILELQTKDNGQITKLKNSNRQINDIQGDQARIIRGLEKQIIKNQNYFRQQNSNLVDKQIGQYQRHQQLRDQFMTKSIQQDENMSVFIRKLQNMKRTNEQNQRNFKQERKSLEENVGVFKSGFQTKINNLVESGNNTKVNVDQLQKALTQNKADMDIKLSNMKAQVIISQKQQDELKKQQNRLASTIQFLTSGFEQLKTKTNYVDEEFQKLKIQYRNAQNMANGGAMTFKQVRDNLEIFQTRLDSYFNEQILSLNRLNIVEDDADRTKIALHMFENKIGVLYQSSRIRFNRLDSEIRELVNDRQKILNELQFIRNWIFENEAETKANLQQNANRMTDLERDVLRKQRKGEQFAVQVDERLNKLNKRIRSNVSEVEAKFQQMQSLNAEQMAKNKATVNTEFDNVNQKLRDQKVETGNRFLQFQNRFENQTKERKDTITRNERRINQLVSSLNKIGTQVKQNEYNELMASDGTYRYKIWEGSLRKPVFQKL